MKTIDLLTEKFNETEEVLFGTVTKDVGRSDACRFFFELLVLKTRDMVNVVQENAYGEITVTKTANFQHA